MINGDDNVAQQFAEIFNCQTSHFPIKYLGVPISPSRLHIIDWIPLQEKNGKKLDVWKGGSMSIAGRATLINSSLSNAFIYHMSMYWLPSTIVENLDKQRRTFFWQGGGQIRKYHLVKWDSICKSKKKGGLGIKDIRKMNISLLCKWWWKLETEDGLWQEIVKAKYLKNKPISTVKNRMDDSPVWKDLLKVRHVYLKGRKITTGNGCKTLLWKDTWLDDTPLCCNYSTLYELYKDKDITVQKFVEMNMQAGFRRRLPEILALQWADLKMDVFRHHRSDNPDKISWAWTRSGQFSVKSVYEHLTRDDSGNPYTRIWKAKIPYKIKIFLWLIEKGAILTKDNMLKRNWMGDTSCRFCDATETVDHLLFQ